MTIPLLWKKLRQFAWQWRGVLVAVPSVTIGVIGLRALGLLQALEFPALDQFFLLRPREAVDRRILIVQMTEADLREVGWPAPDATMAKLLDNLRKQQPIAIGLDFYRDLPVNPGHQELVKIFETTPNLVGVRKVVETPDSPAVAPPPVLQQKGQVAANDFVLDADGKIRRVPLYLADKDNQNIFSFGFLLAAMYLEKQGIQPELTPDNLVKLGKAVFPVFNELDGAYVRASVGGYQVILNYRGEMKQFESVTVTDVLNNRVPSDQIRDRVVLIGPTAESLKDLFYVPYSSSLTAPTRMPGVAIHANLVSQILSGTLDGRQPVLRTWNEASEWLWILVWAGVGASLTWQQRYSHRVVRALSSVLAGGCLIGISYLAFLQSWWIPLVPPLLALVGSSIAITSYVARSAADMRRTFGRYLTNEVVASLLETPTGLNFGGERRKVTVLMSDLRGFSAISERLPPEQVVDILNHYLGVMADTITQYNGTINEFIGDGIFVMFGAPIYREDDSQRAIACAVAMQAAMDGVNEHNRKMGFPAIEMGIGINTGEVVVGNVGSQKRAKYTVVGNHVNLSSRIESYTVGRQILISQDTYNDAGGADLIRIAGQMQVEPKGIKEPITIYDVIGITGKYAVHLPEEKDAFVSLKRPIPVRYVVLEGKHVVGTTFTARLVRLSEHGAEMECASGITPLSNLKMNLLVGDPIVERADLYGKVLSKPAESPGCISIRFTGSPPEVGAVLERMRQAG
jgi:adenylate cyclase